MQMTDYSLSNLGQLEPTDLTPYGIQNSYADQNVINGVSLPDNVIEELRLLGIPLASYNPGELKAAILACAYDSELVDDPHGLHFFDKLSLTHREILEREREEAEAERHRKTKTSHPSIYC